MMRFYLLLSAIFVSICIFGQTNENPLEIAARARGNKLYDDFFEKWAKEVKPISSEEFLKLNDTAREAYNVFTAFYDPVKNHVSSRGPGFDRYEKSKYIVIQDSMPVFISDKPLFKQVGKDTIEIETLNDDWEDSIYIIHYQSRYKKWVGELLWKKRGDTSKHYDHLFDTLINFRPQVKLVDKMTLYLTPQYFKTMSDYLNASSIVGPRVNEGVDFGSLVKFIWKRKRRLDKYVSAYFADFSSYGYVHLYRWLISSYPQVFSITFDHSLQTAKVEFSMHSVDIGMALYKKENGQWKQILYCNPQ